MLFASSCVRPDTSIPSIDIPDMILSLLMFKSAKIVDNAPIIRRKTIMQIVITIALVCFFFGSLNVVSLLFSIICLASSKTSSVSVEEVSEL